MARLNEPKPGLRVLRNRSNDVAKISLVVPAGDELQVSDYVADQLLDQTQAFTADVRAAIGEGSEGVSSSAPSDPPAPPADDDAEETGDTSEEPAQVEETGGGSTRAKSGRRKG